MDQGPDTASPLQHLPAIDAPEGAGAPGTNEPAADPRFPAPPPAHGAPRGNGRGMPVLMSLALHGAAAVALFACWPAADISPPAARGWELQTSIASPLLADATPEPALPRDAASSPAIPPPPSLPAALPRSDPQEPPPSIAQMAPHDTPPPAFGMADELPVTIVRPPGRGAGGPAPSDAVESPSGPAAVGLGSAETQAGPPAPPAAMPAPRVFAPARPIAGRGRTGYDSRGLPLPEYPAESRRRGEKGTVVLEVEVLADGSVGAIALVQDSGFERLNTSAIAAVRAATFQPATEDGRAVPGRLRIPFVFELEGR
jgi:protein TonB